MRIVEQIRKVTGDMVQWRGFYRSRFCGHPLTVIHCRCLS